MIKVKPVRSVRQLFVIVLALCTSACAVNHLNRIAPNRTAQGAVVGAVAGAAAGGAISGSTAAPLGAVLGGIAGGLIGNDMQSKMTKPDQIRDVLIHQGAQVIQMGDNFLISIPNAELFYGNSPRIRWSSYSLLNLVADYLKYYPKISVRVVGYTDDLHEPKRDVALSRARAQNVANYLWSQEIDTRLIYAQGYGQAHPIADNNYPRGRAWNERIEIMFSCLRTRV